MGITAVMQIASSNIYLGMQLWFCYWNYRSKSVPYRFSCWLVASAPFYSWTGNVQQERPNNSSVILFHFHLTGELWEY